MNQITTNTLNSTERMVTLFSECNKKGSIRLDALLYTSSFTSKKEHAEIMKPKCGILLYTITYFIKTGVYTCKRERTIKHTSFYSILKQYNKIISKL